MKTTKEENIRAYFLGKLPEAEAGILEMECAADARLTEHAQMVENELADDYLRGILSTADTALFEANYLTTDARRVKLRVAAGLWQIAREEKPKSAAVASNSIWQTIFRGSNLKLACGGLFLLLACGAIVFYLASSDIDKQQIAEVKVANLPAEPENPAIQNQAPETQTPAEPATENSAVSNTQTIRNINSPQKIQPPQKTAPAPKNGVQNQRSLAVFALSPGTLRDAGEQFLTVAAQTKNLGLRLKMPEDAEKYQIYRAVVKTAEGDSVFTASNLKSSNFTIPAEKLENRTYIIFLEGKNAAGEFESVAEYSFRVRR